MADLDVEETSTVTLPMYDWIIIIGLLTAAANRQHKDSVRKHAFRDLATWVKKQVGVKG